MDTIKKEDLKAAPMWMSSRFVLAVEGTFAFFMLYLLRINFSLAIVCMTRTSDINLTDSDLTWNNTLQLNGNNPESEVIISNTTNDWMETSDCGNLTISNPSYDGEFYWEKKLRGFMLSSFFWGYIVTQIPGGWLATKMGGKHVLGVGMFLSIIANILIPEAARWHPYLVIVLRFIMGLGHGVVFPSMHSLWGRWAPPMERSKLIASTYAGTMIGTVLAMSLSGFLCEIGLDNGWPFIFYIYGFIGVIWFVLWNVLVYNTPSEHPRISTQERLYIEQTIGRSTYQKDISIPWKSIFTSGPVWAIMAGHVCNNWGSYTILTSIPTYMKEVLHYDIKSNGMLSAVPYVSMYFVTMLTSQLADLIRSKHILSTTAVRKIFQTLAALVPSVFIIAVGYVNCERRHIAVVCLTVAVTFTAFGRSGYSINHVDIAPRFSGILFGITNTAATIPGMVSPYLAAAITKNGTQEEWQIVFYICGGMYAFGWVVYMFLGTGEEQSWAKDDGVSDIVMEVKSAHLTENYVKPNSEGNMMVKKY